MLRNFILLLLFSSSIAACQSKIAKQEVVFVCTHGAARSPIAAAYFNKLADEKDLEFHAVFKGTEPDEELTEGTISGLSKDGFEISDWRPQKVSDADIIGAHTIVTFDCQLPSASNTASTVQWNGTPSISKDYDKARNDIRERVEDLIDSLGAD